MKPYSHDFYHELDSTAGPSASVILPLLMDVLKIESVVDVGCGNGGWLAAFSAAGVKTIQGLDGNWIDDSQLQIPLERFARADLTQPLSIDGRYDLSMSLEVAEHLPDTRAAGFVEDLIRLAPAVLFSAAIPGQGGLNHINEQWPDYWAALFAARGYRCVDYLRWSVWNDDRVTWWYKQNVLLFVSDEALAASPKLQDLAKASPAQPYSIVHPERFDMERRAANPGFGRWLKMGKRLLKRSLFKDEG